MGLILYSIERHNTGRKGIDTRTMDRNLNEIPVQYDDLGFHEINVKVPVLMLVKRRLTALIIYCIMSLLDGLSIIECSMIVGTIGVP